MVIDFHTHTFPEKIARRALEKLSGNSHAAFFTDGTDDGLVRSMQEAGIDISVILPVATSPEQVIRINDSAAAKAEEREKLGLISFGAMHPAFEGWHGELARIKDMDMRGIKVHPVYQEAPLDDMQFLRIYDRCAELGLAVVTHAGFDIGYPGVDLCSPDRSLHALRELRAGSRAEDGFVFILAHMGGWRKWEEVLERAEELKDAGPVMLDTAFSDRSFTPLHDGYWKEGESEMLGADDFMKIIRAYGAERVLFATDSPWSVQAESVSFVRNLPLGAEEMEAVLGGNARRVLRIQTACS
ncbi:MAG: amidohydrolase family protein [Lachnospiraceae bacterium]|nr:amidohydrolase family protein [Lachnospiraceae bacterium]